jgi:hypothetical protein
MTALTSPETCPSACVTPVHASLHQEPSTIPSHGPDPTTRQLNPFVSLHLCQNFACHFSSDVITSHLHTVAIPPPSPPFPHASSPIPFSHIAGAHIPNFLSYLLLEHNNTPNLSPKLSMFFDIITKAISLYLSAHPDPNHISECCDKSLWDAYFAPKVLKTQSLALICRLPKYIE